MKTNFLIKTLMSVALIAVGALSLFFNNSNIKKASATENEPEIIGNLYSIQNVSSTTKVYLDENTYSLVQEAGRTIYMEIDDGGLGPLNPKGPILPTYRFYYYATVTEPIITGKTVMKNDIASVLVAIRYLEQEANWFLSGSSTTVKNNAILSFIRCVREDYTRRMKSIPAPLDLLFGNEINMYQIVAGNHLATSFISDVTALNPGGMKIHYYFASLIRENLYNVTDYGTCPSLYTSKALPILDGIDNQHGIDFIHLVAAFDSIVLGTGNYTGFPPYNLIMEPNTFRHVGSWAGDLQQAGKSLTASVALDPTFSFATILNGNYGFDYCDYYADLDAQNMAAEENLSSMTISDVFEDYYDDLLTGQIIRKSVFVNKIAQMTDLTLSIEEKYESKVYELLKLSVNGTDLADNNSFFHDEAKYYFLRYQDGTYPSNEIRNALAEAFYDWFIQN